MITENAEKNSKREEYSRQVIEKRKTGKNHSLNVLMPSDTSPRIVDLAYTFISRTWSDRAIEATQSRGGKCIHDGACASGAEGKRTTLILSDNLMAVFLYFCPRREDITGRAGGKQKLQRKSNSKWKETAVASAPPPRRNGFIRRYKE